VAKIGNLILLHDLIGYVPEILPFLSKSSRSIHYPVIKVENDAREHNRVRGNETYQRMKSNRPIDGIYGGEHPEIQSVYNHLAYLTI
jgi:hypothetical protein